MTIAQGGNDDGIGIENGARQTESNDYSTVQKPMDNRTTYAVINSAQNDSLTRPAAVSTEGEEIGSVPVTSTTGDMPIVDWEDMTGPGDSADADRQETVCSAPASTWHARMPSHESPPDDMPMVRNVAYGFVTPKPTATDSTERRVAN